ncbi:hypothetical protein EYF80_030903 [Liparis tanakae]|uniref:Uncharacterized protein n=1 Tax=Liparis tanakae TaxID=230148 RepID=A0A4Z2H1D3_9TELE|nr:hypothetical protein EYF80_030903 [Liparis tanakae]
MYSAPSAACCGAAPPCRLGSLAGGGAACSRWLTWLLSTSSFSRAAAGEVVRLVERAARRVGLPHVRRLRGVDVRGRRVYTDGIRRCSLAGTSDDPEAAGEEVTSGPPTALLFAAVRDERRSAEASAALPEIRPRRPVPRRGVERTNTTQTDQNQITSLREAAAALTLEHRGYTPMPGSSCSPSPSGFPPFVYAEDFLQDAAPSWEDVSLFTSEGAADETLDTAGYVREDSSS